MGLGSRRPNSGPEILFSSSRSAIDGCLNSTALIVFTGDEAVELQEWYELVEVVEADEERRNDVRIPWGVKRDRMAWKRDILLAIFSDWMDLED